MMSNELNNKVTQVQEAILSERQRRKYAVVVGIPHGLIMPSSYQMESGAFSCGMICSGVECSLSRVFAPSSPPSRLKWR